MKTKQKKQTKKQREEENRMFELLVNYKLAYHDLVQVYDEEVEITPEDISELESIPDFSWEFRVEEVGAIMEQVHKLSVDRITDMIKSC